MRHKLIKQVIFILFAVCIVSAHASNTPMQQVQQAESLLGIDNELSLEHAELALKMAQAGTDKKVLLSAHEILASVQLNLGNIDNALENIAQAEALAIQHLAPRAQMANIYFVFARVLSAQNRFQSALAKIERAQPIFAELADEANRLSSMLFAAKQYRELGQPEKALQHFGYALSLAKKIAGPDVQSKIYAELALSNYHMDRYEEAQQGIDEALQLDKTSLQAKESYLLAAEIAVKIGELERAEKAVEKYEQLAPGEETKEQAARHLAVRGDLHRLNNDTEKAIDAYHASLKIVHSLAQPRLHMDILLKLSEFLTLQKNFQEAFLHYSSYVDIRTNFLSERQQFLRDDLSYRTQLRARTEEIEILQKDREYRSTFQSVMVLGFGMMGAMFLLLVWRYGYHIRRTSQLLVKNAELEQLIGLDHLTKLPTQSVASQKLSEAASQARKLEQPLSFLLINIDGMEKINDNYGHSCGDYVLMQCAQTLKTFSKSSYILSRWLDSSFLICIPEATTTAAIAFAEKLRLTIEVQNIQYRGKNVSITATIGIAPFSPESTYINAIELAKKAVARGKKQGGNQVVSSATQA